MEIQFMGKLRVITEGFQQSELALNEGVFRVGRTEDNDWCIPHPSVSSHHCELTYSQGALRVRDNGSTNGTFLDGNPVVQATVAAGQRLKFGDVEVEFEVLAPVGLQMASGLKVRQHEPKPPPTDSASDEPAFQKRYAPTLSEPTTAELGLPDTFFKSLPSAFSYPIKGDAWLLLVLGTVFFGLLDLAKIFSGLAGLGVGLFGTGYLYSFVQSIIASTGMGDRRGPEWPEFSDWWSDILTPAFQFTFTTVVVFLPAILCVIFAPEGLKLLAIPLGILGVLYLPMGFLAVAMLDSVFALNPMLIVPSIVKVLKGYLIACLALGLVLGVQYGIQFVAEVAIPIPVVPALIGGAISFYFITVMARMLGLLYYYHKDELGWV